MHGVTLERGRLRYDSAVRFRWIGTPWSFLLGGCLMRVPFVHRKLGFGRRDVGAESGDSAPGSGESAESTLPSELTGPVVLLPAAHISPHQEPEREWWRRPGIYVGSAAILLVLGTGAGILVSKRGGESQSASNDATFRTGVSALTLPDEDLRIAPTARDSVPTTTTDLPSPQRANSGIDPAATDRPAASDRSEPAAPPESRPAAAPSRPSERARPAESTTVRAPDVEPVVSRDAVIAPPPDSIRRAGSGQPVNPPVVSQEPIPAPQPSDAARAGDTVTASVPEPSPALDPVSAVPDPFAARPALMAGIARLITAINTKRSEVTIRSLLLDPASQQEVIYLVREQKPTASLGTTDEVEIDQGVATLGVQIGFRWRGSFGVEERETRRFEAVAERDATGWEFTGVRMLGDIP